MVIWLLLIGVWSHAQDGASGGEAALFRREVNLLNERYEDFFARQSEQEAYYNSLKKGIPDVKETREKYLEALERARKEFRREPPADTSQAEAEHEAMKRAAEAVHERYREAYVRQQEQLRRISESARKIPENQDAGLE